MKISGTDKALPKEKILINISLLKEGIIKLRLKLSKFLHLKKAYNYDLNHKALLKKEFIFEVSKFKFKNNLALAFYSDKIKDLSENVSIKIEALDIENNIKEMSIFDIEILKPVVQVDLFSGKNPGEIKIKIEKKDSVIGASFKEFNFSAIDTGTGKKIKIFLERYSLEEFIENIDSIPMIIDWKAAFKRIIINSDKPIKLCMKVLYSDVLGNEYKSNKASIELSPVINKEAIRPKNEIIANPIFQTIGFELPLAVA